MGKENQAKFTHGLNEAMMNNDQSDITFFE